MVFVKAKPGESKDSLIRKFSQKVFEEGIIQQIKERRFYKSPSEIRKERKKKRK